MFTPLRCRVCYDKLNIFSDITLGDPWVMSGVDWEHGDNLIITRTETGEKLLSSAVKTGAISVHLADKEEMLRGQGVNRRRKLVQRYTQAYREMPFALVDAAIVSDEESVGEIDCERKVLQTFIDRDTMGNEELYAIATDIIRNYERKQQLLRRIWRRIKNIIKNL